MKKCKIGDPRYFGKPGFILVDRRLTCAGLVDIFHDFYVQTGYGEVFQAEVKSANYFLTEYPESQYPGAKADFDEQLNILIQDTSPALQK